MNTEYDLIIVGTGVAGLYGALNMDEKYKVLLISKRELTLCNSSLAQGGVAAVTDTQNDSYQLHIDDTFIAGGQENCRESVDVLVHQGPAEVMRLLDLGVDFDRDSDGNIDLTLEGGHSRHRILHHKDSTGREMVDKLLYQVRKKKNVDILEDTMLYGLEPAENGFFARLLVDKKPVAVACKYCLLATGGIGRVYRYTTNSAIATGDGIAIAHSLGAQITHLSYVQFHPTAFAAAQGRERFLISESVRGEGAHLVNCNNERFMDRYDERRELAPRDVVSHCIMTEARKTHSDQFFLDISFEDPVYLKNRFPMIYRRCLQEGVDMTKEKIPVFPCQHYLMGGIQTDIDGQTTIDRLFAAGECSHTGVHGHNRLASNSLLEALVFSHRAADKIMSLLAADASPVKGHPSISHVKGMPLPHGLRTQIRDIMQSAYFVMPDPIAIREGLSRIRLIYRQLTQTHYEITPDYIEARSLATVAHLILSEVAAAQQKETVQ